MEPIAVAAALLRAQLPDVPLREGATMVARVASRGEGRPAVIVIAGMAITAELPPEVPEGAKLRLRVQEVTPERITLKIEPQPAAKGAPAAQAPQPGQPGYTAKPAAYAAPPPMPGQAPQSGLPGQAARTGQPVLPGPGQPALPGRPTAPGQAAQPSQPAVPAQPQQPGQPAAPGQAQPPAQPAVPGQAQQPAVPAQPPAVPGQAQQPGQPAVPGQAPHAGDTGDPAQAPQPGPAAAAGQAPPAGRTEEAARASHGPQPAQAEAAPVPQTTTPTPLIANQQAPMQLPAKVEVEEPPTRRRGAGGELADVVSLAFNSPTLGRLDLRLELRGERILAEVTTPAGRSHSVATGGAERLRAKLEEVGLEATVKVRPRHQPLDLYA
jgi:hypothetical protein